VNLAVGFFDGLHRGHQRILARADAVLTFRDHPATVFAPARVPPRLMTTPDRLAALADQVGADRVNALAFTPALAAQTPESFAAWLRTTYPDLREVLCGPNWTFGAGGCGTPAFLRARGFTVTESPYAEIDGAPVSSTRIRTALGAGDLAAAMRLLGRPWRATGTCRPGKHLGTALGFPTLNLLLPAELVTLPHGAYVVDTPLGRGVANYGLAPTMGDRAWTEPVLEVHLLADAPRDTPTALAVEFLAFLRPEQTFPTPQALSDQIARDAAAARAFERSVPA